jgi:hypothetical protein
LHQSTIFSVPIEVIASHIAIARIMDRPRPLAEHVPNAVATADKMRRTLNLIRGRRYAPTKIGWKRHIQKYM